MALWFGIGTTPAKKANIGSGQERARKKYLKQLGKEKMSKTIVSKKQLMDKLDRLMSKWVRERDEGICPFCHQNEVEVCCHIIHRAKYRTRFHEKNLVGGCSYCNGKEESDGFMKQWFIDRYSQEEYDALEALSNYTKPWTIEELENMIELYSQ